ncbi:hypothetical protein LTR53_002885 [Teratosphaeriaceae sp. CCFEE 6253]|nr:hypothetical protein LTR53_002885 [Teratosphaeriaceae sp. CCFEE 6253]
MTLQIVHANDMGERDWEAFVKDTHNFNEHCLKTLTGLGEEAIAGIKDHVNARLQTANCFRVKLQGEGVANRLRAANKAAIDAVVHTAIQDLTGEFPPEISEPRRLWLCHAWVKDIIRTGRNRLSAGKQRRTLTTDTALWPTSTPRPTPAPRSTSAPRPVSAPPPTSARRPTSARPASIGRTASPKLAFAASGPPTCRMPSPIDLTRDDDAASSPVKREPGAEEPATQAAKRRRSPRAVDDESESDLEDQMEMLRIKRKLRAKKKQRLCGVKTE